MEGGGKRSFRVCGIEEKGHRVKDKSLNSRLRDIIGTELEPTTPLSPFAQLHSDEELDEVDAPPPSPLRLSSDEDEEEM